jgi:membrane-associated phospholipid phosphatase
MRAFFRRRLSAEEYLGLHLTIGLLLCLGAIALFAAVAHGALGNGAVDRFDHELGESLARHREAHPWVREFFLGVTQLGSENVIIVVAVVVAILLVWRRQRLLALAWLCYLLGGGLLDAGLKLVFGRDRPEFRDVEVHETTLSFPSGHAMGSLMTYGLLIYLLALILPRRRGWGWIALALVLLILLIGCSRIYLGAHYFSDVLGGYCVGLAWLAACISAIETVRRRARKNAGDIINTNDSTV